MYCKNCGSKIEESAKFCSVCGNQNNIDTIISQPSVLEKLVFYSQDWDRDDGIRGPIPPTFDILITERFLYLVALPSNALNNIAGVSVISSGLLGGLLVRMPILYARSKAINNFRLRWINSNQELISTEYENTLFFKIPKKDFKNSFVFKKDSTKKVVLSYKDKKITLQGHGEEFNKLKNFIEF
jgi:hypothetical protein